MPNDDDDSDDLTMWSRPFTFGSHKVRIEEGWGLGIGGTVWEGGVLLARYLSSSSFDKNRFKGKRCIELGAGVSALPTIAAAHLGVLSQGIFWKKSVGSSPLPAIKHKLALKMRLNLAHIMVTDIDECIEALTTNLAANIPAICSLHASPAEAVLDGPKSKTGPTDGWDIPKSVLEATAADFGAKVGLAEDSESAACRAQIYGDLRPVSLTLEPEADSRIVRERQHQEQKTKIAYFAGTSPSRSREPEEFVPLPQRKGKEGNLLAKEDADQQKAVSTTDTDAETGGTDVIVRCYDWREDAAVLGPPFDIVLVADVVYIAELMAPLLQCMHRLSDSESLVLLAYYERSKAASEAFWGFLPNYFSCEKIPEASYGVSPQPQDVGLFRLKKLEASSNRQRPGYLNIASPP